MATYDKLVGQSSQRTPGCRHSKSTAWISSSRAYFFEVKGQTPRYELFIFSENESLTSYEFLDIDCATLAEVKEQALENFYALIVYKY